MSDLVAAAMEQDRGWRCRPRPTALCRATMAWFDTPLVLSFEHRVNGNEIAILEYPDLVSEGVNLYRASPGGVGHAVGIATDADHALPGDAALQA